MTVGQLRDDLLAYPNDMMVVVDGYEDGFDDPTLSVVNIQPMKRRRAWWQGLHRDETRATGKTVKALAIRR